MKKVLLLFIMLLSAMTIFSACASYEHEHLIVLREAKAATCTQYGNDTYYECKKCHEMFLDENCTRQIQYQDVVKAKLAHTPKQDWVIVEDGHYHCCEACGEKLVDSFETHDFKNNICVECGYEKLALNLQYELTEYSYYYGKSYWIVGLGNCTDEDIIIPSEYEGLPVTAIKGGVFKDCTTIKSIRIPNSVMVIESEVFKGCTNLSEIIFEEDSKLKEIGPEAFYGCESLLNIDLPNGMGDINYSLFSHCGNLQNIKLSDNTTKIDVSAFEDCYSLQKIELPDGIRNIDDQAFKGCRSLKSVKFSNALKSIGTEAFYNCKSLQSIELANGLTSIGRYAFVNCTGLKNISLPNTLESVDNGIFSGCNNIEELKAPAIIIPCLSDLFLADKLTKITISNGDKIEDDTFQDFIALQSVTLSDTITSIGKNAFRGCAALQSVVVGKGVNRVNMFAFYGCYNLQNVYYCGTADEWDAIEISHSSNASLDEATRFYYSDSDPQESEEYDPNDNYWHYGDNGEIVVWNK